MQDQQYLFVGGSWEGLHALHSLPPVLTFVDGLPVRPAEDGSITAAINAMVETYTLEQIDGPPQNAAYFLAGMERREADEHLARLLKKLGR